MQVKKCTDCNVSKSIDQFWPRKASKDKFTPNCKECRNARKRKAREQQKGYYARKKLRYKIKVVTHYSNRTMCCRRCGIDDIKVSARSGTTPD